MNIINHYVYNAYSYDVIYKKIKYLCTSQQLDILSKILNNQKHDYLIKNLIKYSSSFDYRLKLAQIIRDQKTKDYYFYYIIANL